MLFVEGNVPGSPESNPRGSRVGNSEEAGQLSAPLLARLVSQERAQCGDDGDDPGFHQVANHHLDVLVGHRRFFVEEVALFADDTATEPGLHQLAWLSRYLSAEQVTATKFAEGMGCTYCNMTGYRGRVGVYELLEIDADLADAIRRTDLVALERLVAQLPTFIPLVQRALKYAIDGVTSIDEVMRSMSGLEEPERRSSLVDDVLRSSVEAGEPPASGAATATG